MSIPNFLLRLYREVGIDSEIDITESGKLRIKMQDVKTGTVLGIISADNMELAFENLLLKFMEDIKRNKVKVC